MTRDDVVRSLTRTPRSGAALLAAGLGAAIFLVLTIAAPVWPLPFARVALLVAIATAGAAVLTRDRLRVMLLVLSTVLFLGVGFLGILTVGILILPLAVITAWAALAEAEPTG